MYRAHAQTMMIMQKRSAVLAEMMLMRVGSIALDDH